jgi:hypothetical protein
LAEEIDFGSAEMHTLQWLVKDAAYVSTCRKECNKYDQTSALLSVSD